MLADIIAAAPVHHRESLRRGGERKMKALRRRRMQRVGYADAEKEGYGRTGNAVGGQMITRLETGMPEITSGCNGSIRGINLQI